MGDPSPVVVYAVWPTAWGAMGAVRNDRGLCRTVLPYYSPGDLADLLAFEHRPAPRDEGAFEELIELSQAYFNGQPAGFESIRCDLAAAKSFAGRVLRACREIPRGQTRSYRGLATAAGNPDGARAAAATMSKNRIPLVIPCHRVIYTDGRLGGFSAPAGVDLKARMLRLEGAL